MISDNYPGGIASAAYAEEPKWRPIDECDTRPGRRWMVALAHQDLKWGDRQRPALMAIAFCTESGGWAHDEFGQNPLHFAPNWFAAAPYDPPWPPPGVPMPEQPA